MHTPLPLPIPQVQSCLDGYGRAYHQLKTPRKLVWWPSQGHVELCLQVGPDTLEITVDPVVATTVLAFRQRASLSQAELVKATGLPAEVAAQAVHFWVLRGVLLEEPGPEPGRGLYRRATSLAGAPSTAAAAADEDMAASQEPDDDPSLALMASFEPFIIGMLANFNALTLDRIHNMLKVG